MAADQARPAEMSQDHDAVRNAIEEHRAAFVLLARERAFLLVAPERLHRSDEAVGQVGHVVVHVAVLAAGNGLRDQRRDHMESARLVSAEPLGHSEMQIAIHGDVDRNAEEFDFQVCLGEVAVNVREVEDQAHQIGEALGRANPLAGPPAVFRVQGGRRVLDRFAHRELRVVQPRFVFAGRMNVHVIAQQVAQHVRDGVPDEVDAFAHDVHFGGRGLPGIRGVRSALGAVERIVERRFLAFLLGVVVDLLQFRIQVLPVVDAARRAAATAASANGRSAQISFDHIGQAVGDVHEVQQVIAAPDRAALIRGALRDKPGIVFVQVGVLVHALDARHALVADHGGFMVFRGLLERDAVQRGVVGVILVVAVEPFSADEPLVQTGGESVRAQDREMIRQSLGRVIRRRHVQEKHLLGFRVVQRREERFRRGAFLRVFVIMIRILAFRDMDADIVILQRVLRVLAGIDEHGFQHAFGRHLHGHGHLPVDADQRVIEIVDVVFVVVDQFAEIFAPSGRGIAAVEETEHGQELFEVVVRGQFVGDRLDAGGRHLTHDLFVLRMVETDDVSRTVLHLQSAPPAVSFLAVLHVLDVAAHVPGTIQV